MQRACAFALDWFGFGRVLVCSSGRWEGGKRHAVGGRGGAPGGGQNYSVSPTPTILACEVVVVI
jgi:hypothetical protein